MVLGFSAAPASIVESSPAPAPVYSLPKEEPEKIKKWREEQKLRLEKKGTLHSKVFITTTFDYYIFQMKKKKKRSRR